MEFTDVHDIPCLGPDDYPAVALYMQELANIIEAELLAQQTALDTFLDTGSLIWTQTDAQTASPATAAGFEDRIFFPATPSGGAGLSSQFNMQALPPLRGWYYVGGCTRVSRVGVVAGTIRALTLRVGTVGYDANFGNVPLPGNIELASFIDRIVTPDTQDFDNLWCGGTVFSDGLNYYPMSLSVFNGEAVSLDVDLATPSKLWLYYMGEANDIRQVG